MKPSAFAILAWVVLACNHRAAAPVPTPSPDSSSRVHAIVAPGRGSEINLAFDGPYVAKAAFRAESALDWNVHSHPDGGVIVHQSGTASAGVIEFRAPDAGTFSFLWKNKTANPIPVDIDLTTDPGVRRLDE